VELHVLLIAFVASYINLFPDRMRHLHGAFVLGAVGMKANFAQSHPLAEVVPPAVQTEGVAAGHS